MKRFSKYIFTKAELLAVALATAFCLFTCSGIDPNSSDNDIVFLFNNSIYKLEESPTILFETNKKVFKQSVYASDNGIYFWDSSSKKIFRYSGTGKELSSINLDAQSVWINKNKVLSQSNSFVDGGFEFKLYKFESANKIKLINTVRLDLFMSDIVFDNYGNIYITGGSHDDTSHYIYHIDAKGNFKKLYSTSKNSDFMRLAISDSTLYAFASNREKVNCEKNIYFAEIDQNGASIFIQKNIDSILTNEALCFFGFGFTFNNKLCLPVAMSGNTINIVKLSSDCSSVVSSVDCRGCYNTIGNNKNASKYCFISYDPTNTDNKAKIAWFDGQSVSFD